MNSELEQKLMNNFSFMEAKNVWNGENLGYPFPCEVGDGWFQLIYDLCNEVKTLYEEKGIDTKEITIEQVKEKYGGLRFYIGNYIDGVDEIVSKYENLSYSVCEKCGSKGETIRHKGWVTTLCLKCSNEESLQK